MDVTYPPGSTTGGRGRRLRLRGAALALMAFALAQAPAVARDTRLKVLAAATIDDGALGSIAPLAWSRYVATWLGRYRVVTYSEPGAAPTVEDCRKDGADYIVIARFGLRPLLPGLQIGDGRISARSRLHVVDCATGVARSDVIVDLEGDPVESVAGDAAQAQDSRWDREIPAALAKVTLDLQRPRASP